MERTLKQQAEQMVARTDRQRKARRLLAIPAALVAAVTTFMLMSPALALEREAVCGMEEHTHGEACYGQGLICGFENGEVVAAETPEGETVEHTHTHTDVCYGPVLVCELPEHTHSEACFAEAPDGAAAVAPEPVCGIEEHTHEDACYDENGELICGKEEHTHSIDCLADPADTADEEDAADGETADTTDTADAAGTDEVVTPETADETVNIEEDETPEGAAIVKTFEDAQVRITAIYTAEANLPEGVELIATPITAETNAETFDKMVKAVNEALPEENVAPLEELKAAQAALEEEAALDAEAADEAGDTETIINEDGTPLAQVPAEEPKAVRPMLLYNIGFYLNGVEVEPEAPVDLEIQFLDAEGFPVGEEMTVVHLAESGAELLKSQTESDKNTASFTAGSFSPFMFTGKKSVVSFLNTVPEGESVTGELLDALTNGADTADETGDDQQTDVTVDGDRQDVTADTQDGTEPAADETEETGDGETAKGGLLSGITNLLNGYAFIGNSGYMTMANNVGTEENLRDKLGKSNSSETITLTSNITVASTIQIGSGTKVLDLSGHTITFTGSDYLFQFQNDGGTKNLTIKDSTVSDEEMQTILDSARVEVTNVDPADLMIGETDASGVQNEWIGGYKDDVLTFYTTEVEPYNTVGTKDTRYKYTINFKDRNNQMGALVASSNNCKSLIWVGYSGTLNIEGGRLTNPGGHAVMTDEGATNKANHISVTGGFLCGNGLNKNQTSEQGESNFNGGAIFASGLGSFTLGGHAVIAANKAWNGGGVYLGPPAGYFSGHSGTGVTTVNVNGNAIVASNWATGEGTNVDEDKKGSGFGGGGLSVVDAGTLTISDSSYITNNWSSGDVYDPKAEDLMMGCNDQGGGGLYCSGVNTINIQGGNVTGNFAWNVGGGIMLREDYGKRGTTLHINKGNISSNVAYFREGGGMWIGMYVDSYVETENDGDKVYITNNKSYAQRDWGGGGIFVHGWHTSMKIRNSIITNNTAGGYGGGVGGCSTGRLFIAAEDGAAIYGNAAKGENLTHSEKTEDGLAYASSVFKQDYQDYFCALASSISSVMLGGGNARWSGSIDYNRIEEGQFPYDPNNPDKSVMYAGDMTGLTAHPEQTSIDAALKKASVFISGNYCRMHGGGIMCNGVLTIGETQTLAYRLGVQLSLEKQLTGAEMTEDQFRFLLLDEDPFKLNGSYAGHIVARGYSDAAGEVNGLAIPAFPTDGWGSKTSRDFVYYLLEDRDYGNDGRTQAWDATVYQISVTVKKKTTTLSDHPRDLKLTYYITDSATIKVGNLISGETTYSSDPNITHEITTGNSRLQSHITIKNNRAGEQEFNNVGTDMGWFRILKKAGDRLDKNKNPLPMKGVTFELYKPDATEPFMTKTTADDGLILFEKLEPGTVDKEKKVAYPAVYYLYEKKVQNYEVAGPWIVEVTQNIDKEGNPLPGCQVEIYAAKEDSQGGLVRTDEMPLSKDEIQLPSSTQLSEGITVVNQPVVERVELPATGGMGTTVYTVSGLSLIALALYLGIRRRKASR